jgi:hypothetical protein
MYSLLSGFFKYARRKEEYAVLLLGLDNAGKTVCCARPGARTHARTPPTHAAVMPGADIAGEPQGRLCRHPATGAPPDRPDRGS